MPSLIDKLNRYNASLIAFDIIFSERDTTYPEDDRILWRNRSRSAGNVILPMHIHPAELWFFDVRNTCRFRRLIDAAKALGHVHVELDEDGLSARHLSEFRGRR